LSIPENALADAKHHWSVAFDQQRNRSLIPPLDEVIQQDRIRIRRTRQPVQVRQQSCEALDHGTDLLQGWAPFLYGTACQGLDLRAIFRKSVRPSRQPPLPARTWASNAQRNLANLKNLLNHGCPCLVYGGRFAENVRAYPSRFCLLAQ
jgi:hypothetical protein